MDAKSRWIEILKEIVVTGVIAGGLDALRNGAKKTGDVVVDKIISKMEERRGEMLAFIRGLAQRDSQSSKNLLERQRVRQFCQPRSYGEDKKPYVPGDEDHFVTLLTKLYIALDEPHEKKIRTEVFVWLGRLSDEDFDATIEFLHHDVFIQWLKRSWGWVKNIGSKLSSDDKQNPGFYQRTDQKANGLADQLRQFSVNIRARYERRP